MTKDTSADAPGGTGKSGKKQKKGVPAKQSAGKTANAAKKKKFIVVGIGASAGGLEAMQAFVKNLPQKCPEMAFVIVSHLDPKHASLMPELLQKNTGMQVSQIENGMKIEPNRIFVIPPDRDLELTDNTFRLKKISSEPGPRAPINHFLSSLANRRGETSVAIILSGMGSDGTIGVQKIKGELGMILAQDPSQARYSAMPESVINTGLTDFIQPVEEMPAILSDYVDRLLGEGNRQGRDIPSESLQKLLSILRSRTGNDFTHYKKTLQRRISRRMKIHGFGNMAEYIGYLRKNEQENQSLVKEMLIGVTGFFRDPQAFEKLTQQALPALVDDRPAGYTLRAWVAGCSTGEEAYSLAITLQEYIEDNQLGIKLQIFATDLDENAIETARKGFYTGDIAKDVSPARLKRFFSRNNDGYRVVTAIRESIVFAKQSIIKDPPFTRLDLISCRNLLKGVEKIY